MISRPDPVQCRVRAGSEGGMHRGFSSTQLPLNGLLEECLPGAYSNQTQSKALLKEGGGGIDHTEH